MADSQVQGCHLVGSVCLDNAETVFRQCTTGMPNRLKRITDGETGMRSYFVYFQNAFFASVPEMSVQFTMNGPIEGEKPTAPDELERGLEKLRRSNLKTQYDDYAIESYALFKRLRDEEEVMPPTTRLQVCLPTPPNVVLLFTPQAYQAAVEPIYEKALYQAIRNIQDHIPKKDLAIQIDLAVDTAFMERLSMYPPWFDREGKDYEYRKKYMVDYITRMIGQVDEEAEVGIHNCYGDMEHRHYFEPTSLRAITDLGVGVFAASPRKINFFHLPVPLSTMGSLHTFYAPLAELVPYFREHGTDLYLGLVHYNDLEGTKKRIEAAKKALGNYPFGVATECGWGRTPHAEIENIMEISRNVSSPVM